MEDLQEYSEQEESKVDLKAELYKYLKYWKWLVFGCLLGLAVAYLYNRYTIPKYQSQAAMMVLKDDQNKVIEDLPSGGGSFFTVGDNNLQSQIETLRSKRLVENVIKDLGLNVSYFIEGKIITVEAYKNSPVAIEFLSPDSIVHKASMDLYVTPQSSQKFSLQEESRSYSKVHTFGEEITLGGVDFIILPKSKQVESSSTVHIKLEPLERVANNFISRLWVEPKGKAQDILALYITGEVQEKSEDFLNTLMHHFNMDGMADKRQVAENTAEFIQDRLQLISQELDSVEGGIAEFKRENQFMDIGSRAGIHMSRSTRAEEEIFNLETQLMIIRSVREALNSSDPYKLLPAGGTGIQEGNIAELISNYNTLVMERNGYLKNSTSKNPVVQAITDQLDSLRENLMQSIESTINSINIRKAELDQLDRHATGQFNLFPGLENRMRSIERQQQIKEQLYLFLLQRREESAISFAATSPVAKVIESGYSANSPVDPKPWIILTGGGVVGFLIPLLIIFTINFLDTKVHHKGDVQTNVKNIPFLGEIPRVRNEQDEVIQVNDRSPLAESFRILRTNLAYMVQSRNRERAEVIFVTSTIKGEGKTFISYNLARTLASTGKKVLLIGADVRNPRLHRYSEDLSLNTKGLSDYLYNHEIQSKDIIHKNNTNEISVDVILSGAIPPNPSELLMNNRMDTLIKEEQDKYDFIIADTAPTMMITDTLLISQLADTTLYVVRAGHTEKKLLEFPKDLKKEGKLKGVAIILNDVDYSKFSYGAKYGYSYGYGYGYGVEEKKGFMTFLKDPFGRNN